MRIENLSFSYGSNNVLRNISFAVARNRITTIMGANGSGKTTLFQLLTKNLKPNSGKIYLNGDDITRIGLKSYAQKVAIVNQSNSVNGNITVEKLVSYGRTPFVSFMKRFSSNDQDIIENAMEITNVAKYRDRDLMSLSGGQRQRVWIAMALAQNTDILLLDEPTTYLDIRYQIEIMNLINQLNNKYGITIVMVLHDINQALHYSHEIIGIKDGMLVDKGEPEKIVSSDFIRKVYDIDLRMVKKDNRSYVLQI